MRSGDDANIWRPDLSWTIRTGIKLNPLSGLNLEQGAKSVLRPATLLCLSHRNAFCVAKYFGSTLRKSGHFGPARGEPHTFIYESMEFAESRGSRSWAGVVLYMGFSSVFMSSQVCLFIYGEEAAAEVQKRALSGALSFSLYPSLVRRCGRRKRVSSGQRRERSRTKWD